MIIHVLTYFLFAASLLTLSCMKIPLNRCRNSRSEGWTSRNLAASEDSWIPWCSSFSGKTIRVGQLLKKRAASLLAISPAHKMVMNLEHEIISYTEHATTFKEDSLLKPRSILQEILSTSYNFSLAWNSTWNLLWGNRFPHAITTCHTPLQQNPILYHYHPLPCLQFPRLHLQIYRHLDTSLQSTVVVCNQESRFRRQNGCDNHWNALPDNRWRGKPT